MGPCKQSASKEEFIQCLQLNLNDAKDREKFSMLWAEVTTYWCSHFETDDRRILKAEYATNAAIHRPYKWAHINPAVIDNAIQEIRANTTSATSQYYYELGSSPDKRVVNWVLKWLLWHVCRYRDWRNRKGRTSGSNKTAINVDPSSIGGMGGGPSSGSTGSSAGASGGEYAPCRSGKHLRTAPVVNHHLHHQLSHVNMPVNPCGVDIDVALDGGGDGDSDCGGNKDGSRNATGSAASTLDLNGLEPVTASSSPLMTHAAAPATPSTSGTKPERRIGRRSRHRQYPPSRPNRRVRAPKVIMIVTITIVTMLFCRMREQ